MDRIIARMKKSSGRRGDKTPTRRLERRDALKHINYDAASTSTWSAEDISASTSSLVTRSLEFPDRTSFRIFGGGDVEMDQIYKSLGLSGPDDLAISFDAWEACKKRSSSDVINRFKSFELDLHNFPVGDAANSSDPGNELTRSESSEFGSCGNLVVGTEVNKPCLERAPTITVKSIGYLVPSYSGIGENKPCLERTPTITVKSRGYLVPNQSDVGIKGVRPPVLKPPPAKRPPVDHQGSSWDFLTHFAPEDGIVRRPSSSSTSDNGEETLEEEVERDFEGETESVDTGDEACSFSTNEGGGDSSSTVSNTSPIYANGGSIITSWQKGGLLGRGSFGSVFEGISGDGDFFAVKEVSLLEQGSQAQECIQQLEGEIALLSQLQHQNIVRYRGTAKDGSNLYIFLELVTQGSLSKLYQRYQLMDSVVSTYTRQILDGLKYLHDKGFIHRDIKCANILVDANGAVKLADFGLAKVSKLNDIKSCKGTPFWMAPEVINPKRTDGYGSSADIWSLGCTVLEMLTGQIPYCDLENPIQALFRIGRGVLPDIPDALSLDGRDFITECLKVDPEERPTAAELLNHPFVRRPLAYSGSGLGSASPHVHRRG
ncbi:PREDICTED: mitogen-activated protein kinase kinase kinase 1-like isoform X3 [Brassica oleracea var. oleracea]|uniref:mitogen-activated protein kinase kinase kinase 1-like isoform X2 n=1 Tax=Brassica oleracea var. oleracea TaxID=109376 RepID=UPI0006A6F5D8|nr:PREDICTED: mitogen-activated protein kinase kinase kinase 1-like isoform X2 [Brassica oleracea var. oleracea]XP_013612156.1 PREDICTED: mitogen-activated protein kinase kinase kinase 1-like isoform X3 [Brassica oleracea var. oleracea]